jgi:hypothetical protein
VGDPPGEIPSKNTAHSTSTQHSALSTQHRQQHTAAHGSTQHCQSVIRAPLMVLSSVRSTICSKWERHRNLRHSVTCAVLLLSSECFCSLLYFLFVCFLQLLHNTSNEFKTKIKLNAAQLSLGPRGSFCGNNERENASNV